MATRLEKSRPSVKQSNIHPDIIVLVVFGQIREHAERLELVIYLVMNSIVAHSNSNEQTIKQHVPSPI